MQLSVWRCYSLHFFLKESDDFWSPLRFSRKKNEAKLAVAVCESKSFCEKIVMALESLRFQGRSP
jgi:hypothetical protein